MGLDFRMIQVPTKVGMRDVQAEVCGDWACHPAIEAISDGSVKLDYEFWSITQISSGLCIGGRAYTPDLARFIVETLDAGGANPPSTMPSSKAEREQIGLTLSLLETANELFESDGWDTVLRWTPEGGLEVRR